MNKDITLEELGYEEIINDEYVVVYKKQTKISRITLKFHIKTKTFIKEDELGLAKVINFEELQAIYNKYKELGLFYE